MPRCWSPGGGKKKKNHKNVFKSRAWLVQNKQNIKDKQNTEQPLPPPSVIHGARRWVRGSAGREGGEQSRLSGEAGSLSAAHTHPSTPSWWWRGVHVSSSEHLGRCCKGWTSTKGSLGLIPVAFTWKLIRVHWGLCKLWNIYLANCTQSR